MTEREYVEAQTALDRVSNLECAGSLHRQSTLSAGHLRHIRSAVSNGRDIHIDNWHEYRGLVPGLAAYTFNGNLAVKDNSKGKTWGPNRVYREAVSMSDAVEAKRTRKRLA